VGVGADDRYSDFSLLGGPLHRLACRVGLVLGRTNTVPLGLVLGVSCWAILVVLGVAEGYAGKLFSLPLIGGHVRLLVSIPLFFLCEWLLDPRMTAFVATIVSAQIVPATELPALDTVLARVRRWKDSWVPDAFCLLAAVVVPLIAPALSLPGSTGFGVSRAAGSAITGIWYWFVCLPLFRFLVLRWLWRLGLWCYCLWRVSRLNLNLVPTHPDGAGGLGYLEVVHGEFTMLIVAISAAVSAAFAESIVAGATLSTLYPTLALLLAVDAVVFLGPLCIFIPKLWLCRVTGLDTYMEFGARYVNDFEKKWIAADGRGTSSALREQLLGTADVQALADLSVSLGVVRDMRLAPWSRRLALTVVGAALLPMLPLVLLEYPAAEVAAKLFKMFFNL